MSHRFHLLSRLPLLYKLLLWFFFNLAVISMVFVGITNLQFRLGPDSPLRRRQRDPMATLARLLSIELGRAPRPQWSSVLKRYAREYRVELYVFAYGDQQLAGPEVQLPEPVRELVRQPPPRITHPPPFPPPQASGEPGQPRIIPGPAWDSHGAPPAWRVSWHEGRPFRYWVGLPFPIFERQGQRPTPATLLAASNSITGDGLFLVPTPWIVIILVVVLLSVLLWIPMVRYVTHPLSQMTRITEGIAAGHFDAHLDQSRGDEIGRLGRAINHMSSRLAALIGGQKRLLGDVAHELSSPIARIKLGLAIIEHRVEEDKDLKKVQSVIEDAEHMSSLVSELLSFSRAEINPQRVELSPVSLHAVIEKAVRREQTEQAPITCHVDPELRAQAHAELLVRALSNLLRNAVRYASAGGPIEVIACQQDNHVLIEVKDHGPGVPEGLLEQLFAPFFRPEPSRDRKTGGAGLGLAIVKTCVEACKGSVVARNRKPNGLSVTISLDAAT